MGVWLWLLWEQKRQSMPQSPLRALMMAHRLMRLP